MEYDGQERGHRDLWAPEKLAMDRRARPAARRRRCAAAKAAADSAEAARLGRRASHIWHRPGRWRRRIRGSRLSGGRPAGGAPLAAPAARPAVQPRLPPPDSGDGRPFGCLLTHRDDPAAYRFNTRRTHVARERRLENPSGQTFARAGGRHAAARTRLFRVQRYRPRLPARARGQRPPARASSPPAPSPRCAPRRGPARPGRAQPRRQRGARSKAVRGAAAAHSRAQQGRRRLFMPRPRRGAA